MSTKEYPIVENAETFEAALAKVKEAQKIFATYTQEQVDISKKMKQVIFGTDKSSSPLLLANLNEFMRSNGLPVFEVIRRMTRIQDNGKIREYKPWNDKSLVFVPEGRLGVIKNAYEIGRASCRERV